MEMGWKALANKYGLHKIMDTVAECPKPKRDRRRIKTTVET
jgi:hypothetical protein